jgi:hypothetical protein
VRSRPGAARTILLLHIISARPSKQPRMVGSTLGVYSFRLIFVSARTNKRHHHHHHTSERGGKGYCVKGGWREEGERVRREVCQ